MNKKLNCNDCGKWDICPVRNPSYCIPDEIKKEDYDVIRSKDNKN